MTESELQDEIQSIVSPPLRTLSIDDNARAMREAMLRYSTDFDRVVSVGFTTPAQAVVDSCVEPALLVSWLTGGALPNNWELGFSRFVNVLVGGTDTISGGPKVEEIDLVDGSVAQGFRLITKLRAAQFGRLRYTISHAVTDLDRMAAVAVAHLAASKLFKQLAAITAGSTTPAIAADSVDHGAKTRNYSALAKQAEAKYRELTESVAVADQPGSALAQMPARRRKILK